MKLYEGTKRLRAQPMTRGEYNAYRGWTIPENENPNDAGYLVEYEDGGKANDSRHAGYISWSPADVFERTYKEILQPHQQRVIKEKAELDEKLSKLTAFLDDSSKTSSLHVDDLALLGDQKLAMVIYSDVLGKRIARF